MEVKSKGVLMSLFPNLVLPPLALSWPLRGGSQYEGPEYSLYLTVLRKGSLALFLAEVNKFRNIRNIHLSS